MKSDTCMIALLQHMASVNGMPPLQNGMMHGGPQQHPAAQQSQQQQQQQPGMVPVSAIQQDPLGSAGASVNLTLKENHLPWQVVLSWANPRAIVGALSVLQCQSAVPKVHMVSGRHVRLRKPLPCVKDAGQAVAAAGAQTVQDLCQTTPLATSINFDTQFCRCSSRQSLWMKSEAAKVEAPANNHKSKKKHGHLGAGAGMAPMGSGISSGSLGGSGLYGGPPPGRLGAGTAVLGAAGAMQRQQQMQSPSLLGGTYFHLHCSIHEGVQA